MSTVWAIAAKDLRVLGRDRAGLLFILFIPVLFAVFFGAMYGGEDESKVLAIAVVDKDQSAASKKFIQGLQEEAGLEATLTSEEDGESGVRQGQFVARIRLHEGFGERFGDFLQGPPPQVDIGGDPSRRAESAMLEGMLMRNALRQAGIPSEMSPVMVQWTPITAPDETEMPDPFELSFPQGIVWGLLSVVMAFSTSLVNERSTGTLVRLQIAPIQKGHILGAKALACFILSFVVCGLLMILGTVAFGVRPHSWPLLVLALLCVSTAMTGLMMFLATFGKTERSTQNIGWTLMMLMAMAGGGMIPLFFMSDWLVTISQFSPVMWAVTSLEGALWRGFDLQEMLKPCAILLGVGVVAFSAGVARFKMEG